MNKNEQTATMYESIPAVAELNKVPGFNPLKLLRRIISPENGEEMMQLDLRYKKLWFRLANPKGRIRLNALRITEQMAGLLQFTGGKEIVDLLEAAVIQHSFFHPCYILPIGIPCKNL